MPIFTVRFMPFSDIGERVFSEEHDFNAPSILRACEWALAYGSDDLFYRHGDPAEWLVTVFITQKDDQSRKHRRFLTFDPTNPPSASAFKNWEKER